jgi:erythromycin esterase-like protein
MKPPEQPADGGKPHSYFGNVDNSKIAAAAKSLNFLAGVDPALVEKAKGGDADAFMQVMNASNQNTFQTAMAAIPAIMEPVLKQVEQKSTEAVPGLFRQMQLRSQRPGNPVLNDPAWVPVVEALKVSLASQNPQATPDQIVAQVEKHVEAMVAAAAPKQQAAATGGRQQSSGEEDYSFLFQ